MKTVETQSNVVQFDAYGQDAVNTTSNADMVLPVQEAAHKRNVNILVNKIITINILAALRDDHFAEFATKYLDKRCVLEQEDREDVQNAVNKALTKAIKLIVK